MFMFHLVSCGNLGSRKFKDLVSRSFIRMSDEILSERKCETPGCEKLAKLRCPTCIKYGISGSFFCSQECFKGNWNEHKQVHKTAKSSPKHKYVRQRIVPLESQTKGLVMNVFHKLQELNPNYSNRDVLRKTMALTGVSTASIKRIQKEFGDKEGNVPKPYNPWPDFEFTGKLRPSPVTPMREVPASIMRPDYADHPQGVSLCETTLKGTTSIKILDEEEIKGVSLASKLAREVLDTVAKAVAVGVTTDELDRIVHEASIARDCYPSPLNYYRFPKSCCTSVNEVICHGIPDTRPLEDGDLLNIDITVYHKGFHGDLNETFFVGNVDEAGQKLVRVTHECLQKAIEIVKPGEKYREIGNVIQKYVQAHGFSVVRSYCGHGIHRLFHTTPSVPHYAKNKAIGIMKPGHCFTIEPMISEGSWSDVTWPDDWTAVTRDGKRSAQFEQTLLVTETGCEILTRRRSKKGQPYFMDSQS